MGFIFNEIMHIVISPPFASQFTHKEILPFSNHLVNINDKIISIQQSYFVYRATKCHSDLGFNVMGLIYGQP